MQLLLKQLQSTRVATNLLNHCRPLSRRSPLAPIRNRGRKKNLILSHRFMLRCHAPWLLERLGREATDVRWREYDMAARRGDSKLRAAVAARQYSGLDAEGRLIYAPCDRCGLCTDEPCAGCLFRGQFSTPAVRNLCPWAVCLDCYTDQLLCFRCTAEGYKTRHCRKLLKRCYPTVWSRQSVLVTATVEDGKVVRPYSPRVIPIDQGDGVRVDHGYPDGAGSQETESGREPTAMVRTSGHCPREATGSLSFIGPDY